ncbi:MAG: hypothetical protein ACK4IK_09935 [Bacteroidia bacterium]
MRFLILIVTILFLNKFSFSQNCNLVYTYDKKATEIYNSLIYKEFEFGNDNLENAFNYIGNNYIPTNIDLSSQLGNLEFTGYVIESLITMYETTKDKAYLIKAINKSIELINVRGANEDLSLYT